MIADDDTLIVHPDLDGHAPAVIKKSSLPTWINQGWAEHNPAPADPAPQESSAATPHAQTPAAKTAKPATSSKE